MTWYVDLPILAVVSVLPPLLYLWWFIRADTYMPLERSIVIKAFLAGATIGVVGGAVLTLILVVPMALMFDSTSQSAIILLTAVIAAPIAEEAMKGICVLFFKVQLERLASGIILGASIGLGFATTENVLYGFTAASEGLMMGILLVGVRSLTAAFAHGTFTGIFGYGLARWTRGGESDSWWPFYILAVVLHAFFNLVASLSEISDISTVLLVSSTIVLGAMTFAMFFLLRRRVVQLDEMERSIGERMGSSEAQIINPGGTNL